MRNKNVIYLVIDAFCYNNLNLKIGDKQVTPFLNKLILQSTSFEQMYSQAPYTEAAQVSILGYEMPLENGGYLLGNMRCEETLLEIYQKNGYETLFTYSPYVYSKSYLRGVNKFYYTRLFSIEPLFLYRLDYYRKKWENSFLNLNEIKICLMLVEESFETWISQCESLIENKIESSIINNFIKEKSIITKTKNKLLDEKNDFNQDKKVYLEEIFRNFESHNLRKISKEYNKKKLLILKEECNKNYLKKFKIYQKKYSKVVKKQKIDILYVLNKLFQNNNIKYGIKDSMKLIKKYLEHYSNLDLEKYLEYDENSNLEVSMEIILNKFLYEILENDKQNKKYFSYIHVQDFHLPSMFHTYDSNDINLIDNEFQVAFELLEELNNNYKGNIISALSARYCDLKIQKFFEKLDENLKNDYIFIITADHGYPAYFNPPRSEIYNQVYTEAFHVPFIMYNSCFKTEIKKQNFSTSLDGLKFLNRQLGLKKDKLSEQEYVLCEYGGPGCPTIYEKKIWYVLITRKIIISLECSLSESIDRECIKSIFNLEKDPLQKYNLVKKNIEVKKYLKIVEERHNELKEKHYNEQFFKNYLRK